MHDSHTYICTCIYICAITTYGLFSYFLIWCYAYWLTFIVFAAAFWCMHFSASH